MTEERGLGGFLGGIFKGDCTILFFILVFLMLFTSFGNGNNCE